MDVESEYLTEILPDYHLEKIPSFRVWRIKPNSQGQIIAIINLGFDYLSVHLTRRGGLRLVFAAGLRLRLSDPDIASQLRSFLQGAINDSKNYS